MTERGAPASRDVARSLCAVWREAVRDRRTLPREPSLAVQLGVSRGALREALARLEGVGLIARRQPAATTVNPAAVEISTRFDQQVEYSDMLTR